MEKTGIIEWKLTKNLVESHMGREITEDEFELFSLHFKENFEAQFEATLEWQASDWEEVKTWKIL